MTSRPVFRVRFDDATLDEDLLHVTPRGRAAAIHHRAIVEKDGLRADRLYKCQEDQHDGTSLGGCVKTRLPWPDGDWGLVLSGQIDDGRVYLQVIAFGERHPTAHWRPSLYQLAHRRLHGT
jgi:hypothetical protein